MQNTPSLESGRFCSANDQAIAEAVINLAKAMDLGVVAEGIETEEQRGLLQRIGRNAYQDYLFGKPCSPAELYVSGAFGFCCKHLVDIVLQFNSFLLQLMQAVVSDR